MGISESGRTVTVRVGDRELVIRRRYEVLSIVNDILIGLWFLIGSVLFLSASTTRLGTWLFIVGSIELLIRPAIRLARHVHLRRISGGASQADRDF
ncbi:YrhK family protein [Pseudonocardia nematodicida]|uniref:YrhK family protein n=1 Tax=Pseudonocardia nematodicida TaxID=1206997 RepID=A0ABV1K6G1_9PSEU